MLDLLFPQTEFASLTPNPWPLTPSYVSSTRSYRPSQILSQGLSRPFAAGGSARSVVPGGTRRDFWSAGTEWGRQNDVHQDRPRHRAEDGRPRHHAWLSRRR